MVGKWGRGDRCRMYDNESQAEVKGWVSERQCAESVRLWRGAEMGQFYD